MWICPVVLQKWLKVCKINQQTHPNIVQRWPDSSFAQYWKMEPKTGLRCLNYLCSVFSSFLTQINIWWCKFHAFMYHFLLSIKPTNYWLVELSICRTKQRAIEKAIGFRPINIFWWTKDSPEIISTERMDVLGQWCVLQSCEDPSLPGQSAPLYWGAGFVHVRDRVWVPPPHVTVQVPQLPHAAHTPSTANKIRCMLYSDVSVSGGSWNSVVGKNAVKFRGSGSCLLRLHLFQMTAQ